MEGMIERLADTWRWWASLGAFLAFWPSSRFWITYVRRHDPEQRDMGVETRIWLGAGALSLLAATFIMGAVIPWANDGRLENFTRDSLIYRQSVAAGWLLWGCGCWATAIGFAERRWMMAGASIVWWWAMYVAVRETAGAML